MNRTKQPTRRVLLRALGFALLGVPLVSLGRALERSERRRRRYRPPKDATADLWIGHC